MRPDGFLPLSAAGRLRSAGMDEVQYSRAQASSAGCAGVRHPRAGMWSNTPHRFPLAAARDRLASYSAIGSITVASAGVDLGRLVGAGILPGTKQTSSPWPRFT